MLKYRLALAALAIVLGSPIGISEAGERYGRHHGHDHGHDHGRREAIIGSNGLPSVIPGIGTFAGSISGLRVKGNGVFFAIDRAPGPKVVTYRAPKAKIIEISAEEPDEACSFEAGVCVIRPKN
ncbi:hypothetical protein FVA81_13650 [Rhizobium sp. WL3]|uniref:hypothetical protein n=1 Tax=Rhizobium sp. WL3 TaxID=2603277 RepID=UPI0011C1F201|nr:hypothetical protein [Rhizobium sp. WL3]QEE45589.1 hypothetical protein FVA81_13650 [Rhizobium sp. WL3]